MGARRGRHAPLLQPRRDGADVERVGGRDDPLLGCRFGNPLGDPIDLGPTWVAADFSPAGAVFLVAANGQPLALWDVASRSQIGELWNAPDVSRLAGATFSADGATVSLATSDGAIYQWNAQTRQQIGAPIETGLSVSNGLAIDPEGATLAFAGSSDELYLMSPTLHAHTLFDDLTGGEDPTAMAISPDGATVATAHAGGEILVWNAEDGSAIGDPLLGHDDTIFALDFNHDGTQLASASRDGTARIWEVGGGPQSGAWCCPSTWPVAGPPSTSSISAPRAICWPRGPATRDPALAHQRRHAGRRGDVDARRRLVRHLRPPGPDHRRRRRQRADHLLERR